MKAFVVLVCCAITQNVHSEDIVSVAINRDPKIVGGFNSSPFQFPHAVALILHLSHGSSFCGGSIIHQNYIITVFKQSII